MGAWAEGYTSGYQAGVAMSAVRVAELELALAAESMELETCYGYRQRAEARVKRLAALLEEALGWMPRASEAEEECYMEAIEALAAPDSVSAEQTSAPVPAGDMPASAPARRAEEAGITYHPPDTHHVGGISHSGSTICPRCPASPREAYVRARDVPAPVLVTPDGVRLENPRPSDPLPPAIATVGSFVIRGVQQGAGGACNPGWDPSVQAWTGVSHTPMKGWCGLCKGPGHNGLCPPPELVAAYHYHREVTADGNNSSIAAQWTPGAHRCTNFQTRQCTLDEGHEGPHNPIHDPCPTEAPRASDARTERDTLIGAVLALLVKLPEDSKLLPEYDVVASLVNEATPRYVACNAQSNTGGADD